MAVIVIAPGLRLRSETAADEGFVARLYAGTRAAELAAVDWPAAAKASFLEGQHRLQQAHFASAHPAADRWIVERARAGVGRLYLDRSGECWRVLDIALTDRAQGQGIGTALLGWVMASAQRQGAAVDLHVLHGNARATALYRRLGFLEVESAAPTHARLHWVS